MALSAGTHLGPHEIVAPLGAGGMGEVYTARDTRLDRTVAVKVLPTELAADPERRARFEREARAVAALQHPNICTIYDVGVAAQGVPFLVMELLPGETLQRRLARGPLDDSEFVEIATALTGALDAAHTSGIIHRDIKPANILLTGHGPKILDFGLAKATFHPPVAGASMEPTRLADRGLTGHGHTVGTIAYMSPEQLRGEDVDVRTAVFSLGLVLYEMATGRPAFGGATSAMISAAILHDQLRRPRNFKRFSIIRAWCWRIRWARWLGRALAQAGDTTKAKVVYEDLLALWKDADPDLELPKRAKAEFSALR